MDNSWRTANQRDNQGCWRRWGWDRGPPAAQEKQKNTRREKEGAPHRNSIFPGLVWSR